MVIFITQMILRTVTASLVKDYSASGQINYPDAVFDYCNVTLAYSHTGREDQIQLQLWLPSPGRFQNRWLSTGGGGFAINSGSKFIAGGPVYGAAGGLTDGGFGGFDNQLDAVFPTANGTANWNAIYSIGYEAHQELALIGKAFTQSFYETQEKQYAYYMGCSEGGREGWSQVQRFPDLFDGVIIGAPAIHYGQQQVNHLFPDVVEQTIGYYPPPCEMEKIMNLTIAACDALDGKVDGVVARSDLCKLHFNVNSTIGQPYHCPATTTSEALRRKKRVSVSYTTPAQNGTVSAEGALAASIMLEGLHTQDGKQAYMWYQPGSAFSDAETQYNADTDSWELSITALGGEWVARFLELRAADNLDTLQNVTYDTLKEWMQLGWTRYADSLQTQWPDLTAFHEAGGKILHYHGESDASIPTSSSVRYHDSVRRTMYPGQTYNDSIAALGDWYRLFLVPGAAHCELNPYEANGPFPQTNIGVMIDWVENGVFPTTLNATHLAGPSLGANAQLCAFPLRPLWTNNGSSMECVYDQASIDTWHYDLDAWSLPLY
ncbi:tannase and feruloyl esterase [Aspergillus japonicus CBS 114.51]|uniref:Carboxylic ester hydrolase n=1 Tax=Aspergillus japonicus CBS 114.51 TaxID=1448312 RepID=A0A8T8XHJ1_ASPJA|nr:tannase and feruloyl esterase [Aspergillus japonicus CBS 114.51]RAH87736.1 tannase and feruloyl esterase [Aspergillus japonicus CBS 114.51]